MAAESRSFAVEVDGRPILLIYAPIAGLTPQERAEAIHQRIIALANNREIPIEAIHAKEHDSWTEIDAGGDRLMGITEDDARAAEKTRSQMATEYTEIIREVVKQYRKDHTINRILWGTLYAVEATICCVVLFVVLFAIRRKLRSRFMARLARAEAAPADALKLHIGHYLGEPLIVVSRVAFWLIILAIVQGYITIVLTFFPTTKYVSRQITTWLFSQLSGFGRLVVGYIPNLVLLIFICVLTSCLIKVSNYFFRELREAKLTIRGFYPDWADPTAKLVRFLILAAAVVVAFPYLPGSESPAFKGISVFLGVLLSLGSTSAVAHAVAGTILTYMRAFQAGDFVRIGSDVGEVVEKTLLVTRIRTQKNELVTIPNGTILGGVVVNYTAETRKQGVIFHTVVTIGYSAPWRQVHDLLISAALATEDVLHDPPPFVLQTALNDFYVSYELNAHTDRPCNMLNTYSMLHQNIQDKFNEAGVEINSPHYTSLRDGNRTTTPESYLPDNYRQPSFELSEVNGREIAKSKAAQRGA